MTKPSYKLLMGVTAVYEISSLDSHVGAHEINMYLSISSFLQTLTMILTPSYVRYLYHLRFLFPWSAPSQAQMLGATTRDSALENTVGQPQGSVHNRGNVVTK